MRNNAPSLLPSQGFSDPIHLHCAHPSRIAAIRKHKLIVQDRLHLFTKQDTGGVNRHRLVPHNGAVATIWDETGGIRGKPTQEAFQDQDRRWLPDG